MNRKWLVVIVLAVVMALSASTVFSQDPTGAVLGDAPESTDSTWGEHLFGSTGCCGTWWSHTATTGETYAVVGHSSSTSGRGMIGVALANSGETYGVWGRSFSTGGRGVFGETTATSGSNYGVYGSSASSVGVGTLGRAVGSSGTGLYGYGGGYGARAYAGSSGTGLLGYAGRYGLRAYAYSTSGDAIYALATATSGPAYAVNARTNSSDGWSGYFTSAGNGVRASASGSYGMYASARTYGVYASATSYGVFANGRYRGVYGRAVDSSGIGVQAYAPGSNATGTYSYAGRYGMRSYAYGTTADAIYAQTTATSGSTRAVNARSQSPTGWAGWFTSAGHGVLISTPSNKIGLTVLGGSKNAAVATEDGPRLLYSEESTEVWFSDYGFGQLRRGRAVINIDPTFSETVNLEEGYHVFLQSYGDTDLYVSERTPTHFVVRARGARRGAGFEFSYRLVAKRAGYEGNRLEAVDLATMEMAAEAPALEELDIQAREPAMDAPAEKLEIVPAEQPLDLEIERSAREPAVPDGSSPTGD